jgi:putative transposase
MPWDPVKTDAPALVPATARRPLRTTGAMHHLALRRADGSALFHAAADRARFDHQVGELLAAHAARAHAYCWMSNHVHLAIEMAPDAAAGFQQKLAEILAIGDAQAPPLVVDAETYLLRLVRYIHLNPVNAGLVGDPIDYPWSGHRVYLGLQGVPWLTMSHVLRLLGGDLLYAIEAYRRYVRPDAD